MSLNPFHLEIRSQGCVWSVGLMVWDRSVEAARHWLWGHLHLVHRCHVQSWLATKVFVSWLLHLQKEEEAPRVFVVTFLDILEHTDITILPSSGAGCTVLCCYWMLTNHSVWITTVGFSLVKQPFLLSVRVVWVALTAQIQFNQTIPRLQSQELSSGSVVLFEKLTVRLRTIVGIIRKRSSLPARFGAVDL